jgi:hypothetical protein
VRAADDIPGCRRLKQESLQGLELVVRPVLLAKADKRREFDKDYVKNYTLLAYTRHA